MFDLNLFIFSLAFFKGAVLHTSLFIHFHHFVVVFSQRDETAMMAAASRGHAAVVSALLDARASPDAADDVSGWDLLHVAANLGCR